MKDGHHHPVTFDSFDVVLLTLLIGHVALYVLIYSDDSCSSDLNPPQDSSSDLRALWGALWVPL